ncbi:universal stress protein [Urechidicola croceus]|uniref:Universal stress protein UspA n=1 Tax=Urechidicola croceus TaxID=1850246 RepID=A0A1D8P619_9FLAO|nr:universal stress protein [Urechidicola croceus]AOW20021.1 universal stress protein UspA [Urechidicola croceus]
MKKIIVPVDFSKHSEYALKVAAVLATKSNAEIVTVHMLELPDTSLNRVDEKHQLNMIFLLKLAEKKFNEFLNKEYLKNIKVTPIIKHYKVFKELDNVAKEEDADLIVIGSHGSSGIKEVFIGSNAEKVVRNSDVPVLVIKEDIPKLKFENVVFVSDFTPENMKSYLKVKKMFKIFNSKISLLYVNLPYESFKSTKEIDERIETFLLATDENLDMLENVHYVADYTVEKGVANFSEKLSADIIAIPTHGRKGTSHFFNGSIGEDLANHLRLPVMTFKI